ncbi:MAG: spondin domain-containing protein [Pseudomonadales bacterium]|nr:spondin domain-containing protein [Pseudomonadales bacterium]
MKKLLITSLCLFGLAACDRNSDNFQPAAEIVPAPAPVMQEYQIEITNLTLAQPLSPIALITHDDRYRAFSIGDVASTGLEVLAEGGSNVDFLAEVDLEAGVFSTMSAAGPTFPGNTEVLNLSIEGDDVAGMMLSIVSMLINTNDAITAVQSLSIENLQPGEMMSVMSISYDSGTEANTEALGTIPGPVDGGEGFNVLRDDLEDQIRGHSGVVTVDDGMPNSILGEMHRWDNPVARITITRTL